MCSYLLNFKTCALLLVYTTSYRTLIFTSNIKVKLYSCIVSINLLGKSIYVFRPSASFLSWKSCLYRVRIYLLGGYKKF